MPEFKIDVATLGEATVEYEITNPGMAPRYGEDPDPGHELELQITKITMGGRPVCFDDLYVKLPWRYVPVNEWLLEQAHEHHRCG